MSSAALVAPADQAASLNSEFAEKGRTALAVDSAGGLPVTCTGSDLSAEMIGAGVLLARPCQGYLLGRPKPLPVATSKPLHAPTGSLADFEYPSTAATRSSASATAPERRSSPCVRARAEVPAATAARPTSLAVSVSPGVGSTGRRCDLAESGPWGTLAGSVAEAAGEGMDLCRWVRSGRQFCAGRADARGAWWQPAAASSNPARLSPRRPHFFLLGRRHLYCSLEHHHSVPSPVQPHWHPPRSTNRY
jgi:hypothetical protein